MHIDSSALPRVGPPTLPPHRALVRVPEPEATSGGPAVEAGPTLSASTAFVVQRHAQEEMESGLHLPRWRERAAAYAQPKAASATRFVIEA